MVVDRWLSGEVASVTVEMVDQALDELEQGAENISSLADAGKYWAAYMRLTTCISFLNMAAQQQPSKLPRIIQHLLNWIQKIKSAVDKIAKGIGANGYSIGVSAPFGVSVSISFPV